MSEAACGAVVVTFEPPAGLARRLQALQGQVRQIVVVDNGPVTARAALAQELAQVPALRLIGNDENRGIAAALNQGLAALAAAGCDAALLLDHDSVPDPQMLPRLLAELRRPESARAAACVPRIRYDLEDIRCRWPATAPGARWRFRFAFADRLAAPCPVDLAISSGMLLDLAAWRALGGFDEALFIDLVDTELCLRARAGGWSVVAVPQAELRHSLGAVQRRRLLGVQVYPTHHGAHRHYYLARNRVRLYRAYARRFPSWALYETLSAVKLLVKALCFEPGRWAKLRATWRGTLDGLRGRGGALRP
jgi:rhamnosyltransferase